MATIVGKFEPVGSPLVLAILVKDISFIISNSHRQDKKKMQLQARSGGRYRVREETIPYM